jgi:hypothetical protein
MSGEHPRHAAQDRQRPPHAHKAPPPTLAALQEVARSRTMEPDSAARLLLPLTSKAAVTPVPFKAATPAPKPPPYADNPYAHSGYADNQALRREHEDRDRRTTLQAVVRSRAMEAEGAASVTFKAAAPAPKSPPADTGMSPPDMRPLRDVVEEVLRMRTPEQRPPQEWQPFVPGEGPMTPGLRPPPPRQQMQDNFRAEAKPKAPRNKAGSAAAATPQMRHPPLGIGPPPAVEGATGQCRAETSTFLTQDESEWVNVANYSRPYMTTLQYICRLFQK